MTTVTSGTLHVLVVIGQGHESPALWQQVRARAVAEGSVLSVAVVDTTGLRTLLPATPAAAAPVRLTVPSLAGRPATEAEKRVIDHVFEARAAIGTIQQTQIHVHADAYFRDALVVALGGAPGISVHLAQPPGGAQPSVGAPQSRSAAGSAVTAPPRRVPPQRVPPGQGGRGRPVTTRSTAPRSSSTPTPTSISDPATALSVLVLMVLAVTAAGIGALLYLRTRDAASVFPFDWAPYPFFGVWLLGAALFALSVHRGTRRRTVVRVGLAHTIFVGAGTAIGVLAASFVLGRLLGLRVGAYPNLPGIYHEALVKPVTILADTLTGVLFLFPVWGIMLIAVPYRRAGVRTRAVAFGAFLILVGAAAWPASELVTEQSFTAMMAEKSCGHVSRIAREDGSHVEAGIFATTDAAAVANRVVVWQGTKVLVDKTLRSSVPCTGRTYVDLVSGSTDGVFGEFLSVRGWPESLAGGSGPNSQGFVITVSLDNGTSRVWRYPALSYNAGIAYGPVVVSRFEPLAGYGRSELRGYSPDTGRRVWTTRCPAGQQFVYLEALQRADGDPLEIFCSGPSGDDGSRRSYTVSAENGRLTSVS